MAIEIKELVVRAVALEEKERTAAPTGAVTLSQEQMEILVQQCAEQVLKILERKNAR